MKFVNINDNNDDDAWSLYLAKTVATKKYFTIGNGLSLNQ